LRNSGIASQHGSVERRRFLEVFHFPRGVAQSSAGFREDIDGLRAIAVLPVVFFHAGIPGFSGGFIGVDVFFVISGFLITGILLRSLDECTYSIRHFYERRIRRILPALSLVLLVSTVAALIVYPPETLKNYAKSLASVSLFGSNLFFWKSIGYFAEQAETQPLLHTWSLAVEEQFYIFYPLLLWLLARRSIDVRRTLLLIGGLSLALSIYATSRHPGANFYLLPTRAWELMAGGIIAASPRIDLGPKLRNMLAAVGIAMIAACVVFYTGRTPFPGAAAIPPVLGTALVVLSGHNSANHGLPLLRSRPLVTIGQASYSFYLWHFPALAFAVYLTAGTLPLVAGLSVCAASLLAALITLKLLEDPVRRSRKTSSVLLPLIAMAALGCVGAAISLSNGLPQRIPAASHAAAAVQNDRELHHEECMSLDATIVRPSDACLLGVQNKAPSVLLWGDSHAMVTATSMEAAAKMEGASFLFAATADCPPGLGFEISHRFLSTMTSAPSYRYCGQYNRDMLALALSPEIRTIVISSRWTNWRLDEPLINGEEAPGVRLEKNGRAADEGDNKSIFKSGFAELVERLTDAGKRVIIVGPLPEPRNDVPKLLYVQRFGFAPTPAPLRRSDFERRHAQIIGYFAEIARKYPVTFINPVEQLCPDGSCPIEDHGVPRFFDDNHLTVRVAQELAPMYRPVFRDQVAVGKVPGLERQ
jgi:peptidoglycan/LPS O-acetylase OafA/YrhL